jgi:hypothetical protein
MCCPSSVEDAISVLGGGAALAPNERTDEHQVHEIEYDAGCESYGIEADHVVDGAGEPASERHARAAE